MAELQQLQNALATPERDNLVAISLFAAAGRVWPAGMRTIIARGAAFSG
jgi:hypothetical protein